MTLSKNIENRCRKANLKHVSIKEYVQYNSIDSGCSAVANHNTNSHRRMYPSYNIDTFYFLISDN